MKVFVLILMMLTIAFVGLVRFLEKTSVFYPDKMLVHMPSAAGLDFEDVYFKTADQLTLHGWFIKAPGAKATFIFFHGNAGNIGDRIAKLDLFHQLGVNVFIIDYRGYGLSEGQPSEPGLYRDALAAWDYLQTREDIDPEAIVLYGASLGGAIAIDLATKRKVAAIIIDSSFSSAADMAKVIYPFIPSFLINIKWDSQLKVKNLLMPKLFFHSPEDQTVPLALGQKLFREAMSPKKFVELRGSHNEGHLISKDIFLNEITAFLREWGLL